MDIDQQVNQIVQNIITEITTKVQAQAMTVIEKKVQEVISAIDVTPVLAEKLSQRLDEKLGRLNIDSKTVEKELSLRIDNLATTLGANIEKTATSTTIDRVNDAVRKINVQTLCQQIILDSISAGNLNFPDNSIPSSSIDLTRVQLSGDSVKGGIIQNFGSTGIDDQATGCQLSIFDEMTVIENNLLTKDLTVKGSTTIEGDLKVTGTVPKDSSFYTGLVDDVTNTVKTGLDDTVFDRYADKVFNKVLDQGLDLNKIRMNGKDIIDGGNLATHITASNLQKLGTLNELRVRGEALLSDALYTSGKRVGIGTIEPSQVLSVWDQEVELTFSKKENNVGILEAPRNQRLILSSNGKNNLSLMPDGSVAVNTIQIGQVYLSSSMTPPSDDAPKGTVLFNANPTMGGPLGWISLGQSRWANFGFID